MSDRDESTEPDVDAMVRAELLRAMTQPIDVEAIYGRPACDGEHVHWALLDDPGDDPWGGANLFIPPEDPR